MKEEKDCRPYRNKGKINRISSCRRKLFCLIALFFFSANLAFANPYGPQVVNGNVTFQNQGNTLTVTNSPNSIINWQGFSIGANELTRFVQQHSLSAVLNRVVGQDPSAILGALQSNGRVFLINPNGILFGPGARIDVNGLIASTLNLSNQDFLAGRYNFTAGIKAGLIENQGTITTPLGGQVYLIAPDIKNTGIINSPQGDVILAAGHSVQMVDSLNPYIAVTVSAPENAALNLGKIIAESGRVGIYGGLIDQKGIVKADSAVVGENGKIYFKASKGLTLGKDSVTTANGATGGEIKLQGGAGTTLVSGTVTAAGSDGRGGEIQVLGRRVGLTDNAMVDASGATGGGTVLMGGDYQGRNAAVPNAEATYIGKNAAIKADAATVGDGGKVIVWSDRDTSVAGKISAQGGFLSGNGGFVETSGHKLSILDTARVNTLAPKGLTGNWLLDPLDFTIAASGGDMTGATVSDNLKTSDVTIQTNNQSGSENGDIFVNDSITWSANKLTLNAYRNIEINKELFGSGTAQMSLLFGQGASDGYINSTESTYTLNAPVNLPAGNNFSTTLGAIGNPVTYYVITSLGNQGSTTGTDLQGMAGNLSGKYALGANIDASDTINWNNSAGFAPITSYDGAFDGLGHTISNLTIARSSTNYVGLFGSVGSIGTVRHVGLTDVDVTGLDRVGGLVGYNVGNISNSYTTGSVAGSGSYIGGLVGYNDSNNIKKSYSAATVTGGSSVGGLVGENHNGTVTNSHATGDIKGDAYIGGLVGANGGDIANSYSTGDIACTRDYTGGLVGYNNGTITKSYATGVVNGERYYTGGLVGWNDVGTITDSYTKSTVTGSIGVGGLVGNNSGMISNTYSTGFVSGSSNIGGLVGINNGGTVSKSYWDTQTSGQQYMIGGGTDSTYGRTTADMMSYSTFQSWDFAEIWGIKTGGVSYPYLKWQFSGEPQIVSGMLDVTGGGKPIKLAASGSALSQVYTGANGFYYFALPGNSVANNVPTLTYVFGNDTKGASVHTANGSDMTGLDLYTGALYLKNLSTGSITNSTLATAKGSLSDSDILYSISNNNLTVTTGVAFKTASGTTYDLNGNVITQDASQTYGGLLTLSTNAILSNTGTNGNINFGDSVSGSNYNLTLDTTGAVAQNGAMTLSGLGLRGAGTYTLNSTSNSVETFASEATGTIDFNNNGSFFVGTVNEITGIKMGDNSVTLKAAGTNGDLTISHAILKDSGTGTGNLTLQSNNDVILSQAITSGSGKLNLTFIADSDTSGGGATNIAANINTNGGGLTATGGSGTVNVTSGTLTLGGATVINNLNLLGGILDGAGTGILTTSGAVNITGTNRLDRMIWNNDGAITIKDDGQLKLDNSATLDNNVTSKGRAGRPWPGPAAAAIRSTIMGS